MKSRRKEQHKPKQRITRDWYVQGLMMLPYALFMGGEKQEIGQTLKGLVCYAKEFGLSLASHMNNTFGLGCSTLDYYLSLIPHFLSNTTEESLR